MVVVRSDVARGRIRNISASAACRQGGVIGVFTADDLLAEFGEVPFIQPRLTGGLDVESFRLQPVLAVDEVRYVGEPVAVVLAESIAEALDAAELVEVDIEGFRASSSIDDGELLESFAGVEGDATPGEHDRTSRNQPPLGGVTTLGKSAQGRDQYRNFLRHLQ